MIAKVDVSVNLCTYNRKEMLRKTLRSLVQQETDGRFSFEIVVIDDASTDGTSAVVEEISRGSEIKIKYIKEGGKGEANSRNRAVRESIGDWVALIDDDEVPEPCWLKELVAKAFDQKADCIGGRMKLILPTNLDSKIIGTARKQLGETAQTSKFKKKLTWNGPGGGNALVNKKVFDHVGGFDTSMVYGGTDQDFFRRARRIGYTFAHAHNAVAYHIIPSYRLEPSYLRLTSRRNGKDLAYFDLRENGIATLLLTCSARLVHAAAITLPRLICARITNNEAELMSRRCSLWTVESYTRQTLFMLFPSVFPQKAFFGSLNNLEFRDIITVYRKNDEACRQRVQ